MIRILFSATNICHDLYVADILYYYPRHDLASSSPPFPSNSSSGIVMGVFVICWLPFFVTNILMGICPDSCISDPELVGSIVTWLGWINSGMNPIIYACWSRDFRRAFKKILCGSCTRRQNQRDRALTQTTRYNCNHLHADADSSSFRQPLNPQPPPAFDLESQARRIVKTGPSTATFRDPVVTVTH